MTYTRFYIGTSQNSSPRASVQILHCNTSSLLLHERVTWSYTTHRTRAVPGPRKGGPCLLTGCTCKQRQSPLSPVTSDQRLTSLALNCPCRSGSTKIPTKLFISWARSSGGLTVLLLILLSLQKQMQTPYLSNASSKLGAATGPAGFCTPVRSWWSDSPALSSRVAAEYSPVFPIQ